MSKFIIIDWANNHVFKNKQFDSFEDGINFLSINTEEDELDEFLVVEAKDFKSTPLSVLDILEGRSYRAQM